MAEDYASQLEERLHLRNDRGGGGRRGGGRGGGQSRRGGGGGKGREVEVSKALSKLLRHRAEDAGVSLDEEGYAPLDRVVSLCFLGGLRGGG